MHPKKSHYWFSYEDNIFPPFSISLTLTVWLMYLGVWEILKAMTSQYVIFPLCPQESQSSLIHLKNQKA